MYYNDMLDDDYIVFKLKVIENADCFISFDRDEFYIKDEYVIKRGNIIREWSKEGFTYLQQIINNKGMALLTIRNQTNPFFKRLAENVLRGVKFEIEEL
jgi:hypothetical protein